MKLEANNCFLNKNLIILMYLKIPELRNYLTFNTCKILFELHVCICRVVKIKFYGKNSTMKKFSDESDQ